MLSIPNLYDTPFHRIEAGLTLPADRLTEDDWNYFLSYDFSEAPLGLMTQLPGERPVFVSVKVEPSPDFDLKHGEDLDHFEPCQDGEIHAEVSISIADPSEVEAFFGPRYQSFYFKEQSFKLEQSDAVSIWNPLELFLGKPLSLYVEGSFSVERKSIPPQSLVASMIGLRTVAGAEQFLLSGAQFAVRGFPDDTVSWYLAPGSSGQKVAGQLVRQWMDEFHWDSISDSTHTIQARFNRIVMAQADSHVHVS